MGKKDPSNGKGQASTCFKLDASCVHECVWHHRQKSGIFNIDEKPKCSEYSPRGKTTEEAKKTHT